MSFHVFTVFSTQFYSILRITQFDMTQKQNCAEHKKSKPKFRTAGLTVPLWSDRSTEWLDRQHLFVVMIHRNYRQQTQILLYSVEIESGGFQLFSWTFLKNFPLVNQSIDDLLIRKWAAVNRFPKIQTKQKWISIELRNYKQSASGIR